MVGIVQMNRHYFHGKSLSELQSVQFHGFADASERAYGAVVYLRVELTDVTVFTELVTSRTRVAPINGDTTGIVRRSGSGQIDQLCLDSI